MSYVSIIIGFGYGRDSNSLSFVKKDILTIRDMVRKSKGFSIILTDLEDESGNILIDECDNTRVLKVDSKELMISYIESFELILESRILVYYTGHGDPIDQDGNGDSSMRFPNGDRYPLSNLRDLIAKNVDVSAEILFILDCCYSGGLMLPYRLSSGGRFKLDSLEKPAVPLILCLSSSGVGQRSMAVVEGSIFTKHITAALTSGIKNLQTLTKVILSKTISEGVNDEQTMCVYCSYPITPIIYTWITNPNINIYINNPTSCLVIEENA